MKKISLISIALIIVGILIGAVASASFGLNLNISGISSSSDDSGDSLFTDENYWKISGELPDGTDFYEEVQPVYNLPIIELPEPIAVPYNPPIVELPEPLAIELPLIEPLKGEYNSITKTIIIYDVTDSIKYIDSQGNMWIPIYTDPTIVYGTGNIQYVDLEGGFYGIISDDGKQYDPINLPTEFMEDGLRINFKLKILQDQVSFHMWGTLVEILEIEELSQT